MSLRFFSNGPASVTNRWLVAQILKSLVLIPLVLSACNKGADFSSGTPEKYRTISETNTFRAANLAQDGITYQFSPDTIAQDLTLQMKRTRELETNQVDRPAKWEEFSQGHSGDEFGEEFSVTELGKLDLLLVIDDSQTMSTYQKLLAPNLNSLISHISNSDWSIAIITTTSACIENGGQLITRAQYDADPAGTQLAFSNAIQVGEAGSTTERGILMATEGLKGNCGQANEVWRRVGANTAVFILTDEANCGGAINDGEDCHGTEWESADYFLDRMPPGTQFFGLFHADSQPNCPTYVWPDPEQYWRLVDETNGLKGNICGDGDPDTDDDYKEILEQISAHISRQPRYEYDLTFAPVPTTVEASLDGRPLVYGTDFEIEENALKVLGNISLDNDTLAVRYKHDPVQMKNAFRLEQSADPESVEVTVDGVIQPRSAYRIDNGSFSQLYFFNRPGERSKISISYRKNDPLEERFELAENLVPESVQVWINNEPVKNFYVDGKLVGFSEAPRDNSRLRFTYNLEEDRITDYIIPAIDGIGVDSVTVFDSATDTMVDASLTGGVLSVDPSVVIAGRSLKLVFYITPPEEPLALRFDEPIDTETVTIKSTGNDACAEGFQAKEKAIIFNCTAQEMQEVEISFYRITSVRQTYEMTGEYPEKAEWIVSVDGRETDHFTREGNLVTVTDPEMTIDSMVEILVRWNESI